MGAFAAALATMLAGQEQGRQATALYRQQLESRQLDEQIKRAFLLAKLKQLQAQPAEASFFAGLPKDATPQQVFSGGLAAGVPETDIVDYLKESNPQKPEKETLLDLFRTNPAEFAAYERAAHPEKPQPPRYWRAADDAGNLVRLNVDTGARTTFPGLSITAKIGAKGVKANIEQKILDEYHVSHPGAPLAEAYAYYKNLGKVPKTDWELASVGAYFTKYPNASIDEALANYRGLARKAGSGRILRGDDGRYYALAPDALSVKPIEGIPGKPATPLPLRRGTDGRYYIIDEKTRASIPISGMPSSAIKLPKPTGLPRGYTVSISSNIPGAWLLTRNPGIRKLDVGAGGVWTKLFGGPEAPPYLLYVPPGKYIQPGQQLAPGIVWQGPEIGTGVPEGASLP